jgi:oligoribonuclease
MHENTGLWARLATGTPREQVDAELLAFFKTCAPEPKQARLAGNSIRLDMNFLEAYAPGAYAHLHYRTVDVSALAYLFEKWGLVEGHYKKAGTHEALSDIRESLAEYRWLRTAVLEKTNGALDIATTLVTP